MSDSEHRARPGLEPLEGRAVPSPVLSGTGAAPAALLRGTGYLLLDGTAGGTTRQTPSIPDVGVALQWHGRGIVTPLGAVRISGALHGTGFIRSGTPGGTLVLSNAKGTVTLRLVGPTEPGFTPPPSGTYTFSLVKGTGVYARDVADGTVDLTLTSGGFSLTSTARRTVIEGLVPLMGRFVPALPVTFPSCPAFRLSRPA